MDKTRCRNHGRAAGTPLNPRGTCLRLWRKSAIRDELHRTLNRPSYPRCYGYPMPPENPTSNGQLSGSELDALWDSCGEGDAAASEARRATRPQDPVMLAWIEMLLGYFDGDSCSFVTLTYSDAYGYPNGMTKPDNCLRDFKRFLAAHKLDSEHWVVCAEPHQERSIWHMHALLANCPPDLQAALEAEWSATRGHSSFAPLHDGGVNYATKYALKGSDSIRFDWHLT